MILGLKDLTTLFEINCMVLVRLNGDMGWQTNMSGFIFAQNNMLQGVQNKGLSLRNYHSDLRTFF